MSKNLEKRLFSALRREQSVLCLAKGKSNWGSRFSSGHVCYAQKSQNTAVFNRHPTPTPCKASPPPPHACLQPRPPALLVWADRPSSAAGNPSPWTCDWRDEIRDKKKMNTVQEKPGGQSRLSHLSGKCLQTQVEFPEKPDGFSPSEVERPSNEPNTQRVQRVSVCFTC